MTKEDYAALPRGQHVWVACNTPFSSHYAPTKAVILQDRTIRTVECNDPRTLTPHLDHLAHTREEAADIAYRLNDQAPHPTSRHLMDKLRRALDANPKLIEWAMRIHRLPPDTRPLPGRNKLRFF